jgi:hypothetical protein
LIEINFPSCGCWCVNFLTADEYAIVKSTKLVGNSWIFLIDVVLLLKFKFKLMCDVRYEIQIDNTILI